MFDEFRARRALQRYQGQLEVWQAQHDDLAHMVELAKGFKGLPSTDLVLRPAEALFYTVSGTGLDEEHRGRGHYQGGSAGVSVPIGSLHGHAVRYRVGANRGHYVAGQPVVTTVDTGTVYVTNRRVVFEGEHRTRECEFAKLLAVRHDDRQGSTTFSVSNRETPVTVHYGVELAGAFDFRCDLALAHFQSKVGEFVAGLEAQLAEVESARPGAPAGAAAG